MTYNFDPDRWYEDQRLRLDHQLHHAGLTEEAYRAALEELDRRHEEMLRRLDGTFRVEGGGRVQPRREP